MAFLVDQSGNRLVDQSGNALITTDANLGTTTLMLMMRLRIHAAWLLFMLIPT